MPDFLCQNCLSGCDCQDGCTCLDAGGCGVCDCGDGATDAHEIDPEIQEMLSYLAGRPHEHEYVREEGDTIWTCKYCGSLPWHDPAIETRREYTDPAPPGSPGLAPESVALASRLTPDPHPHKWQLNRQLMRYKCQTCGLLSVHNYH